MIAIVMHLQDKLEKFYLTAAEKLNLPASECVVFEDSLTAIRSANAAGFHTVAIYEASNLHEQDMLKAEANLYAKDFDEVILR